MDMNKFLALKSLEQQKVDFEMAYVDMAGGDLIAGLLLSQIIYWFSPDKNGNKKTRVTYKGKRAIAKNRDDWYEEVRITPRQYDRGIKILQDLDIVNVENSMFNGKKTPFIMLNEDVFLFLYEKELSRFNETVKPILPDSKTDINEIGKPLTEITTETTTEITSLEGYKGSDKSPRCVFSFDILDKQIEKIMNSISNNGVIGNLDTNDIKEFFRMYYNYGGHIRNIEPTKLKNEQIENIIDCISYIDEVDYNPSLDDYKKILIDYFNQDFPNCDYSINHFVSGDVLLMRYYNLRPLLE